MTRLCVPVFHSTCLRIGLGKKMKNIEIPLYIVGISKTEPDTDLIKSKFTKVLERLYKIHSKIDEVRITIKKQRTGGKNQNCVVSILIKTPHHMFNYTVSGWGLSNVCEALNQRLIKNLTKRDKKRSKSSIRKIEDKIF